MLDFKKVFIVLSIMLLSACKSVVLEEKGERSPEFTSAWRFPTPVL